jgi:copper(I)-binding protein
MKMWTRWAVLLALLSASTTVAAGEIMVEEPWARASLGSTPTSAAYMTIRSDAPDRLLEASSPAAERVELHNTMEHAGVSQMRPLDQVAIGPDTPAILQPGGLHLMLMGLTGRLAEGETIEIELIFEQAGSVTVDVRVHGLEARGRSDDPGGSGHGQHGSGG